MEVANSIQPTQQHVKPAEITSQKQYAQEEGMNKQPTPVKDRMIPETAYKSEVEETALIKAIEAANKKIHGGSRGFEFSIHEKTKQIMVKVVDTETKEIIREIPPEKILDMVASMCEAAGLIIDEKR